MFLLYNYNNILKFSCSASQLDEKVLNYYLKITGLSREDFYATMKAKRKEVLKDKEIPVKKLNNQKVKKPFVLEMIEEMRKINNSEG